MRFKWLLGLIIIIGLLGLPSAPARAQTVPQPVVVRADGQGVALEWTPPAYSTTPISIDGVGYLHLDMPGLISTAEPGYPQLPLYSALIGLPPEGGATVQVVDVTREVIDLAAPVQPAPTPLPANYRPGDPLPTGGQSALNPDPAAYAQNAFYPADIVQLGQPQSVRGQRVAALSVYPLRFNPAARQLEIIRSLRVEIAFDTPAPVDIGVQAQPSAADPFGQALRSTLLNPLATQWAVAPSAGVSDQAIAAAVPVSETKIAVTAAGLYKITYADLANAGLPVTSLDPRTFRVTHGYPRQEIAIMVEGESDGQFHSNDRLLFYAEPTYSRTTATDIYFLSYGGANGLRMTGQSASPAGLSAGTAWRTATAETNAYYDPLYPDHNGDYWYWDELKQPSDTQGSYSVSLQSPGTTSSPPPEATLTLWLQGYTSLAQNPDHKVGVYFNNNFRGNVSWDGLSPYEASVAVPLSQLSIGTNQVKLTLPGVGNLVEGMWFDALSIKYPTTQGQNGQVIFESETGQHSYTLTNWGSTNLWALDITNPAAPRRLTGHTVTAASNTTLTLGDPDTASHKYLVTPEAQLKSPSSLTTARRVTAPPAGADYIVITHPNFSSAVTPLVAHRAGQGLRTAIIDVYDVYDQYGPGRVDPVAIKNFLQHAYTAWPAPAPTYVLLMGDGTYDFRNYSGYNAKTYIPPFMAHVDPWWGETASDNRFVMLDGDNLVPDMLIGRLPVNTAAETTTVVNKIIQYETNPPLGTWHENYLFVADNADSAGDFSVDADTGYEMWLPLFSGHRYYYSPSDTSQPYLYSNINTLRNDFFNRFRQGASFVTFHGHSSWHQWATEGILNWSTDLTQLTNQNKLPIILEMTCFTSFFHRPEYGTLDESLLRLSGGGAVATWGGTGLGVGTGHKLLQAGFYNTLNQFDQSTLGALTLAGKMNVYSSGRNLDLIDTFVLFGDPAMRLNLQLVTGRVFVDVNGNGLFEPELGELVMPNISVTVTDREGTVHSTATDSSGQYTVSVPAGSTTVTIAKTDPDLYAPVNANPVTANVLWHSQTAANVGVQYLQPVVVGRLFIDKDKNGIYNQSGGDFPLGRVGAEITDSQGGKYQVEADASGQFVQLVPAGATRIEADMTDPAMPADAILTTGNPITISVPANGLSFGYVGFYSELAKPPQIFLPLIYRH